MSIRATNLNLIPVLQALLHEESVVGAAREVSLSQPTVSGALAQLRKALDDPLLVRVGRSMHLTARAQSLRPHVDEICSAIEQLFAPEAFDPATTDRHFVVCAPDYLAFLLSKPLLVRLPEEAPGVRVRFVSVPLDLPDLLHAGTIDLAVCGNFDLWPDELYQPLFDERFVAAVARDHPLAGRRSVSSAELGRYPGVNITASSPTPIRPAKAVTGLPSLDWDAPISLSQFLDAVLLAIESPIVGRGPASLIEYLSTILPLTVLQLSGEEDRVDTGMFWSVVQDADAAHVWLRTLVTECLMPLVGGRARDDRPPRRAARDAV